MTIKFVSPKAREIQIFSLLDRLIHFTFHSKNMSIQKLPDFVINRLKAGEIIDRPASILKELVENSLDAGASMISINLQDGGKTLLSVEDNGKGIELSDMELVFERYATSKITSDEDLQSLASYGFRGEALASIAEVSKVSLLSKTRYAEIGTRLTKRGVETVMKHLAVPFEQGTLITVEDLFYTVPARLKFLKSAQTEFYYCYNYFVDIALNHFDKHFILKKNDKIIFDLPAKDNLQERIEALFKKERGKSLIPFEKSAGSVQIQGIL